ncbi:MAG TPA: ATP-dependent DNA helicase RecG [Thermoanaerobaculia bacterium]|nr:ATP-dependent DNA helicase RecG [Thermoanaerobaculia bacterium]
MVEATTPVRFLKGVGASRAKTLEEHGLATAADLLWFFPFRYEDRRHPTRIADLGHHIDEPVLIRGRIISAHAKVSPVKRMKIFEAALEDESGAVKLVWFNQPFLADQIKRGDRLAVFGAPKVSGYGGNLTVEGPDWEKFEGDEEEEGAIVPIYAKVGNVPPKALRRIVGEALGALASMDDPLPEAIRDALRVGPLAPALEQLHRPKELTDEFLWRRSPAHRRIILQEFFTFQLALRVRRATEEVKKKTRTIRVDDAIRAEVRKILPFRLTGAQKRVLKEIVGDLQSDRPMYRLLQGDVGSGKTIVALIAAMVMIRNGHQVALLAPTEILVEQHFQRISQLLDHSIVLAKATGSAASGERRTLHNGLRDGYIQLVVGTHALLEEKIEFQSLGLAIVDEQHRFGVEQRQRLFAKGETPDILVMTATPIPRSLALAMYGDLELSVIDEQPPGRQAIRTAVRASTQIERIYKFIDGEIDDGAQIYAVYPIIEESEKLNLRPLKQGFEAIRARFPNRRVAMMHGRMTPADKEATMQRFKAGEIDILVSTTVIEVGIDVPNASIMLIMDADRFGMSQLHQLRGRVGRGARKSYCILVSDKEKDRLDLFAGTRDGFQVAERDLQLRGPGEFLGTRQSGALRFRMGNIMRDQELMERARDAAIDVLEREGVAKSEELARRLLGAEMTVARD